MITLQSYGTEPAITRLRATVTTDSYDEPAESWDTPDRLPLRGAEAQGPSSTETETPSADQVSNTRILFVPGTPDITATDRVEIDSEVWRVDGDPVVHRGLAFGVYTTARLHRDVGKG